jgi:hypothetical protein
MNCIHLAQDRDKWWADVNMGMKLMGAQNPGEFIHYLMNWLSVCLTDGIAKLQHLVQLKKTRNSLRKFQASRHCQTGLKTARSLQLLILVAFVCEVGTEKQEGFSLVPG